MIVVGSIFTKKEADELIEIAKIVMTGEYVRHMYSRWKDKNDKQKQS